MRTQTLDSADVDWRGCLKQFVLHEGREGPPGWVDEPLGNWTLSRFPSLPRVRVRRSGSTVGSVLGWFVFRGRFHHRDGEVELDDGTTLDEMYRELAGRFVLLESSDQTCSIRTDAGGQLPVVHDTELGTAGSTPVALAWRRRLEVDAEIIGNVRRSDGKTWYPFGLVPYRGVERLLPGEALHLPARSTSPTTFLHPTPGSGERDDVLGILDSLASVITAVASEGRVEAHLTAGVDSRMVLAGIARAGVPVMLTTFRGKDEGSRLDDHVARVLARSCSLPHRSLAVVAPSEEEVRAWHLRSGFCIHDAVVGLCRSVQKSYDGATVLAGACGEVGRAFFWGQEDRDEVGLEPNDLVRRLGFVESPLLGKRAAAWVDATGPKLPRTQLLDLAYLQQRLGSWAGPSVYGHSIPVPTIPPFNAFRTYERMLALPEGLRLSGDFARQLIAAGTPNLMDVPFNRAQGVARLLFPKQELKRHVPARLKEFRSALRAQLRRSSSAR